MTKLRDIYAREGLTFSIEFFPPKSDDGMENLFNEVQELKKLDPAFVSVTYGAGGSTEGTTLKVVKRLHFAEKLEVMCHLTIVNRSVGQTKAVLGDLWGCEIENIIALAGDPPEGATAPWKAHPDGYRTSRELIEAAKRGQSAWYDFFSVAAAGFPEGHPRSESRESDLQYAKEKVDAGADVIITQLFFDNEDFFRYSDSLKEMGVTVPIVPGVLPIRSAAQVRRFTKLCGAKIPPRLASLLAEVEDDDEAALQLGIDYATEQCEGLLEYGVPGLHFYSLNKSRSVCAIYENLNLGALTKAPA
ncbi:MAG TPA: methylenetetrahydrofolate reductase [NAD(P)H] [Solirubrobacteraceae bacterium]|nr:methylenetetrahydrofolate reductase [NAD(P)H] [Solirubrobacteraceae bacterium]